MIRTISVQVALVLLVLFNHNISYAHCDTYNGPVVSDARNALEAGDVTPVLKWIQKNDEEQIISAFHKTIAVRAASAEAKELADNYFFETVVRIHRAGEGAPYTGLKNEPVEPIIAMSDKAIGSGNIDTLSDELAQHLKKEIKEYFNKVVSLKKEADRNVDAGREYVEAYVIFTHYIEGIHTAITTKIEHKKLESGQKSGEEHKH